MSNPPPEIVDIIASNLDIPTLKAARLVNRWPWYANATKYMFRNITMTPTYEGLHRWLGILNESSLYLLPTRAVLNTQPFPEYLPGHSESSSKEEKAMSHWHPYDWRDWSNGRLELLKTYGPGKVTPFMRLFQKAHPHLFEQYAGFYRSFVNLRDLPALWEVALHFSPSCLGENGTNYWIRNDGLQGRDFREDVLRRFFTSLNARMEDPGNTIVRSLCFRDLQNIKTEITDSNEFEAVMNRVENLSLLIVEESSLCDSINDIYKEERYTFMPILKHDWLVPVSPHLRSLDLSFRDCWGSLPSKFDSSDIHFPQLRHLSLGHYCLAFNDSLDWILNQTTLEYLSFTSCQIVAYIRLHTVDVASWQIDTQDWTYLATEPADGHYVSNVQYHYPGTWAACFKQIRQSLPQLTEFLFQDPRCLGELKHAEPYGLPTRRYVVLDTDEGDGQWVNTDSAGNMPDIFYVDRLPPNRHTETIEADGDALVTLMKQIERR